jgi:hypothetical protein
VGQAAHPRQVVVPDQEENGCAGSAKTPDPRRKQALQGRGRVLILEGISGEQDGVDSLFLHRPAQLI